MAEQMSPALYRLNLLLGLDAKLRHRRRRQLAARLVMRGANAVTKPWRKRGVASFRKVYRNGHQCRAASRC